jgi:hypothetical protein
VGRYTAVVSRSGKVYIRNRVNFFIIIETKRRKEEMKKIILLVIALMMVASVAFAQVTTGNLKELKGTWVGVMSFQAGVTCPATVVIQNDTVPVKATLTLEMVPDMAATLLNIPSGTQKYSGSNDEGKITTQGSIMWAANKNFFEFFYKHGKLDGWFYLNGARGDLMLHKK